MKKTKDQKKVIIFQNIMLWGREFMKIKEMEELLKGCKELEIKTLGDLAVFKANEEQGNLLKVMARYLEINEIYRKLCKRGI